MHPPQDSSNKYGQRCWSIELADRSGKNYILQCNTVIGVAVLLPFLGVSSLNFGPLARVAFFLRWDVVANAPGEPQVDLLLTTVVRSSLMSRHISITAPPDVCLKADTT